MTLEIVLDASALLAMIREEPGGEAVATAIGRSRMSTVNFAEVVSYLTYAGLPSDQVDAMLNKLPIRVIDADVALAWAAGRLRGTTAEASRAGVWVADNFVSTQRVAFAVRRRAVAAGALMRTARASRARCTASSAVFPKATR